MVTRASDRDHIARLRSALDDVLGWALIIIDPHRVRTIL